MKVLAIVLLCAFAAVQGRSAVAIDNSRTLAQLGENPWLVHLRIAVATSGYLNSGAGSLISSNWVLTAARNVQEARFIWVRYGVVDVISPSLVTETSAVRHQGHLGLVSINRNIEFSSNIAPVRLVGGDVSAAMQICAFGAVNGAAGEQLRCSSISVEHDDDKIVASTDSLSEFDHGAALVNDNVQSAVLVSVEDGVATFVAVEESLEWIAAETGLDLSP